MKSNYKRGQSTFNQQVLSGYFVCPRSGSRSGYFVCPRSG